MQSEPLRPTMDRIQMSWTFPRTSGRLRSVQSYTARRVCSKGASSGSTRHAATM